jgi:hypothetical protein
LDFFPKYHDYLWGRSFPNPAGLFLYEPYSITVEISKWYFPANMENGVVGSNPAVYWGELYANFGYVPIFFFPFLLGVGLWLIGYAINLLENTPIKVGLLVLMILHYRTLSVTGISGFILDIQIFCLLVIIFAVIGVSNKLKIKLIDIKRQ